MRASITCCILVLALLANACGPTDTPPPPPGPTQPACVFQSPAVLEVGEGTRAVLAVATVPAATAFRVEGMPEGFEASVEAQTVSVRAPYTVVEPRTFQVVATCGSQDVTQEVTVHVRRISWEPGPSWQPGSNGPVGREYGSMWMDSGDPDTLYVHGGFHYQPAQFTPSWDSWALNIPAGTWRSITPVNEPPHLMGGRVAPVKDARAILQHSGTSADQAIVPGVARFDYAGETPGWTTLTTNGDGPAGDYTGAFVYDPVADRYIQACGANETLGYHCQVYTLTLGPDGVGHWEHVALTGPAPAGRNGFFYAMDTTNHRLVIFSGERGSASWTPNLAQDTWALELDEPMHWVRLSVGEVPALGRRNGAYLHDPVHNRLFVWGGTADGQTTMPGLWVLPLERGMEVWQEVVPDGDAPPRSSGMGVYDAARNRFLVGFGNGTNNFGRAQVFTDLWSLNL